MTGTGVIRLTEADWRVFAALRLRALADSAGTDDAEYRTELTFTGTQWRRRLRAHAQFALARDDRFVGLIAAHRASPVSVYLYSLWTDPDERGRGVAGELLTAAIDWGRELGARTVTLRVHQENAAALGVYRGFGFVDTPDLPGTGENSSQADEVTMSLMLS
ncbi:GNAT family N-acetyltransferase [Mycobacterium sp. CBMA293]|uniref:GNAT family N-acetyltransferase n=1 Tax=unclassified Mycolicibacterium TaxID=2636767 RepID=UPI0012DDCDCE|nr:MULTISPECIES: GNAT family N-acetyltransferase [unclassified Mycolicibacterium]MUL48074.1 GNAT family N-acetyltransferase [Mycolicibacterium sp. CBMA 360]MUL58252.1 GNAT family N-acetyltransferase [Mycolicibacterium sp. CBMA 335]MUL73710.1 GNAT family N-acetyltransferase [Mycolicibacterium sp. CBMA 311]MUL93135.1 GNAT family N-acetyltransferase [Mycolicibacterium sp. CBMA 230]MUM07684.1 GNAT family N-acetyltransferase [Mycolicibacterium sp. CBMA 213]